MSLPPFGSVRDSVNITSQGGSLPRRNQRPGRKNALSQRPCVRDQGEPYCYHGIRLERDGLHQAEFCPCYITDPMKPLVPDRSQPGLKMAALIASHKYATGGTMVNKRTACAAIYARLSNLEKKII